MSEWTWDEVNQLTDEQGGGNDAARHTWLANAPQCGGRYSGGYRPKEGDRVDIFKQFVVDCYEHGKFKADTPYVPSRTSSVSPTPSSRNATSAPVSPKTPSVHVTAPKAASQTVVDLLDTSDPIVTPQWTTVSTTSSLDIFATSTVSTGSVTPSSSFDFLGTLDNTASKTSAVDPFSSYPSTASSVDPFANFSPASQRAPVSTPSTFDPFGPSTVVPTVAADPFASNFSFVNSSAPVQVQEAPKRPMDDLLSLEAPSPSNLLPMNPPNIARQSTWPGNSPAPLMSAFPPAAPVAVTPLAPMQVRPSNNISASLAISSMDNLFPNNYGAPRGPPGPGPNVRYAPPMAGFAAPPGQRSPVAPYATSSPGYSPSGPYRSEVYPSQAKSSSPFDTLDAEFRSHLSSSGKR